MTIEAARNLCKTKGVLGVAMSDLFSTDIRQLGCEVERESPKWINVIEPLNYRAPSIARPYCCYMNTVIFYIYPYVVTRSGGFQEWCRSDTLLTWDMDFLFEGAFYRCGGGRVIRRRKQWHMLHWARLKVENESGSPTPGENQ